MGEWGFTVFGCRENAGKGKDVGIWVLRKFPLLFLDQSKRELHLNELNAAILAPFCVVLFFPPYSSSLEINGICGFDYLGSMCVFFLKFFVLTREIKVRENK